MPFLEGTACDGRPNRVWFETFDDSAPGVPRIFVNGSGSSIADIRPVLPRFGGGRPLAVLDHRGMGRSETPHRQPTMAEYADDVRSLIRHLVWPAVDLIGVSFGGMVAQELMCRSSAGVRRLVLVCTSSGGSGGSSYPLHELTHLDEESRRRLMPTLQDTRFDESWLASHDGLVERMVTRPGRSPDTVGYLMQMNARRTHDVWDRLENISTPTLVASGAYDGIAPPENGRRIAERLVSARHRVYEGGHLFFLQDEAFFVDMEEFLTDGSEEATGG